MLANMRAKTGGRLEQAAAPTDAREFGEEPSRGSRGFLDWATVLFGVCESWSWALIRSPLSAVLTGVGYP